MDFLNISVIILRRTNCNQINENNSTKNTEKQRELQKKPTSTIKHKEKQIKLVKFN